MSEGPEHDELLFIVVHQVYELWFKALLHEFGQLQQSLEAGDGAAAGAAAKRILTILKTVVAQIDVLETMTPLGFGSFRGPAGVGVRLPVGPVPASWRPCSGGASRRCSSPMPRARRSGRRSPRRCSGEPSSTRCCDTWRRPVIRCPPARSTGTSRQPLAPDPAVQEALIAIYRADPAAGGVCERLVDIDEGIQEWRYRHVKMVERTIGARPGTGGSAGAEYLRSTLFRPAFPDLWEIRSRL